MASRSATRPSGRAAPRSALSGGGAERLLTGTVLALVSFGLVMVYSTSSATALLNDGDPLGMVTRQAAYAVVGLGAYAVFARMSPERMKRLGPPALAVAGFLLLVVLVPSIGMQVNGSRRWIPLGGIGQLQPSELAKLALALWVAQAIARNPRLLRTPKGLFPICWWRARSPCWC